MAKTMRNLDALNAEAAEVIKQYEDGLNYHRAAGFQQAWPVYERFLASQQWPAPTDKTRHMPRPVFNVIALIEKWKVSTVMQEQLMMRFSSMDSGDDQSEEAADKFTRFSDTIWEDVKQDALNEEMLGIASNIGTGILHYYWDAGYSGGNKIPYKGRLCGEVLDAINVFFGNPQVNKVEPQPWIIISYRDMLKHVKRAAKAAGLSKRLIDMITPDDDKFNEGYDAAQIELNDSQKVTVFLKYYRKDDGLIYFKKVASGITFKGETNTGMKRYPLAVMQWERRRKSIHGVGDTEGLIPNQRAINFLIAMQILSSQGTGWPRLLIDPMRVDKNNITNEPGEIIEIKNSELGMDNAIKFMQPGAISGHVGPLVESLIDLTRSMSSANDASTGESPGAGMAAAAIMQLQKANGVPVESIIRRFKQMMEDVGLIWEEFFKVRYNLPREIKVKDDFGKEEFQTFTGSDYKDTNLSLKIDIGPSSQFSEALMMASLDKFLDMQLIDFKQYLEYAPSNVVPFKERLLKEIEQREEEAAAQAQQNPIGSLPPEAQAMFAQLPPEEQQKIMQQAQMGGGAPPPQAI